LLSIPNLPPVQVSGITPTQAVPYCGAPGAGALSAGWQCIFVAGKYGMNAAAASNLFLGADGRRYGRALQAGIAHYYRLTCGASAFTGSFTTPLPPRGSTYGVPPAHRPRGRHAARAWPRWQVPDCAPGGVAAILSNQDAVERLCNRDINAAVAACPWPSMT
jgi:hypothetical protein